MNLYRVCSAVQLCIAWHTIQLARSHTPCPLFFCLCLSISLSALCYDLAATCLLAQSHQFAEIGLQHCNACEKSVRQRGRAKERWIDYLLLSSIVYRVHKCAYKRIQMLPAIDLLSKCAGSPRWGTLINRNMIAYLQSSQKSAILSLTILTGRQTGRQSVRYRDQTRLTRLFELGSWRTHMSPSIYF